MSYAGLLAAALGLSADAFTVSVCKGLRGAVNIKNAVVTALFFGVFQAVMPLAGWLLGASLHGILRYEHWVAFTLLCVIGIKMIADALHGETRVTISSKLDLAELFALSVATSIDALALGVTFAFLNVNAAGASVIIGSVTFCVCFAGVLAGRRISKYADERIAALGGAVLIILGVHILFSHTV